MSAVSLFQIPSSPVSFRRRMSWKDSCLKKSMASRSSWATIVPLSLKKSGSFRFAMYLKTGMTTIPFTKVANSSAEFSVHATRWLTRGPSAYSTGFHEMYLAVRRVPRALIELLIAELRCPARCSRVCGKGQIVRPLQCGVAAIRCRSTPRHP